MVWSAFSDLIRGHAERYTFFITESTAKPSLPENEDDLAILFFFLLCNILNYNCSENLRPHARVPVLVNIMLLYFIFFLLRHLAVPALPVMNLE